MPKLVKNDMGEKIREKHSDVFYARVDRVVILLLENDHYMKSKANAELTAKVAELFNCQERQAQNYIGAAKREMRRLGKEKKEAAFRKVIKNLELVMIRARGKSTKELPEPDNKLFLETIKYYAKLNGLEVDEVKQTGEMTMKNIDMSNFTDHGLERLKRGDSVEEVLMDPKSVKAQ